MSDAPIIIETGNNPPDSAVIWLHGLGADGHDFEPIVPELSLPGSMNVRFIFPHAPMIPVTINQGFVMRAWYDITTADIASRADEEGIFKSVDQVNALVDEQINAGIAADRIVLAGFSQGGVIVLHAGLAQSNKLAGIMALSTYLPVPERLKGTETKTNKNTPVFMAHGSIDQVLPIDLGYTARGWLEREGYALEWHEYEHMPHSVSLDEINHISAWLQRVLS